MRTADVERVVRENIDKTVRVTSVDGQTSKLFVHTVDEEGFVCDVVDEMTEPPA